MAQVAAAVPAPLVGGLILGVAAVANLLGNGRVLGISGAVKGLVTGDRTPWRLAFLIGLLVPVPFLTSLLPGSFTSLPSTMTVGRTLVAGFLVGLGAALGNGCTSGHGICGNSRLSVRSMTFTITMMAAGMFATHVFGSVAAIGLSAPAEIITATTAASSELKTLLLGGSIAVLAGLGGLSWALRKRVSARVSLILELVMTLAVAAVFSTGLSVSEMTNSAKVISFLAIGTHVWDHSLMLVMMGAIGVSILPYQLVLGRNIAGATLPPALGTPLLTTKYALPTSSTVDAKLIAGAVFFGLGWGLSGICPGPALVTAASSAAGVQLWGYLLGMLGGMAAKPLVTHLQDSQAQRLVKA